MWLEIVVTLTLLTVTTYHARGWVLGRLIGALPSGSTTMTVHPNRKSAILAFRLNGVDSQVYLPYNRRLLTDSLNYQVWGTDKAGQTSRLIQYGGIPFLVTGQDLGLERVQIHDLESGDRRDVPVTEVIHW